MIKNIDIKEINKIKIESKEWKNILFLIISLIKEKYIREDEKELQIWPPCRKGGRWCENWRHVFFIGQGQRWSGR